MMAFLLGVIAAVLAAEVLDISEWFSNRTVRWAGRRWKMRSGIDHTAEWLDDLEERPARVLRLISALWLGLGSVVPAGWLTLNLPSLFRIARPYKDAVADIVRLAVNLARARIADAKVDARTDWLCVIAIRAAASLLPRECYMRYLEEWQSELLSMPRPTRKYYCVSLLTGAPSIAFATRFARPA